AEPGEGQAPAKRAGRAAGDRPPDGPGARPGESGSDGAAAGGPLVLVDATQLGASVDHTPEIEEQRVKIRRGAVDRLAHEARWRERLVEGRGGDRQRDARCVEERAAVVARPIEARGHRSSLRTRDNPRTKSGPNTRA